MDFRGAAGRRWWLRARSSLAVLAVAALGVAAAGWAAAADTVTNPFSGNWTTRLAGTTPGTVKFSVISAADGSPALHAIGGTPCTGSTTYYHGDYTDMPDANTDQVGTMTACTVGAGHLVGRWAGGGVNVGTSGDIDITVNSAQNGFTGSFTGFGMTYSYSGTFASHFPGDGCCTTTSGPPPPPPAPPKKLQVNFTVGSHFVPTHATVASGARITICNESHVLTSIFSTNSVGARDSTLVEVTRPRGLKEWRLPGDGKKLLAPKHCDSFVVHNPTKAPLKLALFSEIQSMVKLTLVIEPEKP